MCRPSAKEIDCGRLIGKSYSSIKHVFMEYMELTEQAEQLGIFESIIDLEFRSYFLKMIFHRLEPF